MLLRDYQADLVDDIKNEVKSGKNSICTVLGCGGGKSVIIANIIKSATDKKNRVLFLVHRRELLKQIEETLIFCKVNLDYCDIYMIQTASRRIEQIKKPSIIITDECHHSLSATYLKVYNSFNKAIRIGFTATPVRLNEGGLGSVYEMMITGPSTKWLIENKYLAPYRYFSVELANSEGLNISRGDYKKDQVSLLMEKKAIYGDTLKNWLNIANGKKTIIYCASVKSSQETAEEFKKNNIAAAHLDGTTPKDKRLEIMSKFREGEILVLCNNELFSEGLDVSDCECVVLLRPTKSLSLYIQQSMRSMRIDKSNSNKVAIIIDHVKNVYEHGFPDEDREWSLKQKKAKKKCEVPIKQCPKCFMVMNSISKKCPYCSFEIVSESRYEMEKVEMELKELKRRDILKSQEYEYYKNLQTFSQLREFQKEKGYKFGWTIRKADELGIEIPAKYNYMKNKFIFKKC